jgi:hypothetical protein
MQTPQLTQVQTPQLMETGDFLEVGASAPTNKLGHGALAPEERFFCGRVEFSAVITARHN